jgi:hypothetical protein
MEVQAKYLVDDEEDWMRGPQKVVSYH